jgi:hypothetical protein
VNQAVVGVLALLAFVAAIVWALFYERGDMARMLRKTRELRWWCVCCSMDRPGRRKGNARRMVKHMARRREERRWIREARDDGWW